MPAPATWQLPPGVSREVWEYFENASLAQHYDAAIAGTPLLATDLKFVQAYCPPFSRVLDLGAGTGRIAIALAMAGCQVTAVDLSEEMLRVAGAKATAANVRLDRIKANIVALDALCEAAFDVALCLFSTLGMVSRRENRRRAVAHAFRVLRPGGMFLLHVHNRWHNLRTGPGRRWVACDVVKSIGNRANAGDWTMEHHNGQTGWTMHLFTRREVRRLLTSAGFAVETIQPIGLDGQDCLRWSWLLSRLRAYGYLIVARRPK